MKKHLYEQIRDNLRSEMLAGRWSEGECIPTEKDLSTQFGVSRYTVRQAILELVQEGLLERTPGKGTFVRKNKPTSPLREQQFIGVVLPYSSYAHTGEILQGIEKRATELGLRIIFINSQNSADDSKLLDELITDGAAGIIYYLDDLAQADENVMRLKAAGIPFVLVDHYLFDIPTDYVATDNFHGSYGAVKYLLGLGYRKIAFVASDQGMSSVSQRTKGYLLAHKMAGVQNDPELTFVFGKRDLDDDDLKSILGHRPDAIFTTDIIGVRMMKMAVKKGMVIPDEIAFIGFDNSPVSGLVTPSLTTVEQPNEKMGMQAVEIIVDKLAGKDEYQQITLPTKFVIRHSCSARDVG